MLNPSKKHSVGYCAARILRAAGGNENPVLLPETYAPTEQMARTRTADLLQCPRAGLFARGIRILPVVQKLEFVPIEKGAKK